MKPKKTFDCVELKREIQQRVYEEKANLTHDQELAYYRRFVDGPSPVAEYFRRLKPSPAFQPASPPSDRRG